VLIRDLLDLSRVGAQATGATAQIANVAWSAAEDLVVAVRGAGGTLHVDVEPATVRCSEGLLHHALANLGENAVKYRRTEVRLVVTILGRNHRRLYELCVSDNGSGMSPEEVQRAFEPFYRGATARSTPGTGLGLSIVKRVVEACGGTVTLESEVGHGTTFILRLPRSPP
jgi:signal transduction histidine kinase